MKFKRLALSAALALVSATPAMAIPLTLGDLKTGTFGAVPTVYTFSVPALGVIGGFGVFDMSFGGTISTFSLSGPAVGPITTLMPTGGAVAGFTVPLGAGSYSLSVGGSMGTPYTLLTSFTTPVPESNAPALAFAGLGVAGLMLRRRSI